MVGGQGRVQLTKAFAYFLHQPQLNNFVLLCANHNSIIRIENGMNSHCKPFYHNSENIFKSISVTLLKSKYTFYLLLVQRSKHLLMWEFWSVYCDNVILIASLHNDPSEAHFLILMLLSVLSSLVWELICITSRTWKKWWCITSDIRS